MQITAHVFIAFPPRVKLYYLSMKTREEGTPRHGIRRHVDLVHDHGHSSYQPASLAAILRFDVQSLLLFYPTDDVASLLSRNIDDARFLAPENSTFLLWSLSYICYLSAHAPLPSAVTILELSSSHYTRRW